MNLEAIAIQSKPCEHESLALAGAPWPEASPPTWITTICARPWGFHWSRSPAPESSPATWLSYAHDAFLAPTCRLFGLQVRDLHPPDVGVDMLWAEEFAQHFQLSYVPLILRALEHEQPVLAWRGWEGETAGRWGIITAVQGEELWGVVPGVVGKVRLSSPAMQCYVVEQYERRTPVPADMLAVAVTHALAFLTTEGLVKRSDPHTSRIVTGPNAYDVWARWLEAQPPSSGQDPAREAFRIHATRLCAARLSAMHFLQHTDTVTGPDHANILDTIASACDDVAQELTTFGRPEEIFSFWSSAEGHLELLESIRAAKAADQQIADYLGRLAARK